MIGKIENIKNNETMDSWQLIQVDDFEQACLRADEEFSQTKYVSSLRHKWFALSHLAKNQEASLLAETIIELSNGDSEFDFLLHGISLWAMNKKGEAIAEWENGQKALYKDAGGGVDGNIFLYFASLVENDKKLRAYAVKSFLKILKSKCVTNWPVPLASYLVGNINEFDLIALINENPVLHARQSCQTDFVQSLKFLEEGNQEQFKSQLNKAISHGSSSYLEPVFYLSKGVIRDF